MTEKQLGIITSIAVHACVIPVLIAASLSAHRGPLKMVEIDFSLLKEQAREYPVREVKKEGIVRKPQSAGRKGTPRRAVEPGRPEQANPSVPPKEQVDPPPAPTTVTASDVQGEMIVTGVPATYADSTGPAGSLQPHGSGAYGTHGSGPGGGQGGGHGGGGGSGNGPGTGEGLAAGSKDYNYIRDAIMRNVRYPEEAIRLGIEGKVVLSFIVLESGATSKVQVIGSSGNRLLDQSAKEAVAVTRIGRKVPYRVVVHLPITYRLQGAGG